MAQATKSLGLRLGAIAAVTLAPAAVLLLVLGARGFVSFIWIAIALIVGLAAGALLSVRIRRNWATQLDRIEMAAAALENRRAPAHLLRETEDPMGRAERHLLAAADRVVADLDSMAERRDELDAVLRGMSEAVVVTTAAGKVVLLNGAARAMFGLAPDPDYSGRDFVELCRDFRLQEFVGGAMAARDAVRTDEFSIQYPGPRYLRVSAAPLKATSAGRAAWVLVFYDLSSIKQFEKVRSDFIANLAHELRTPLAALRGYSETLMRGVDDRETQRRFLEIIDRQSQRFGRLIDDLTSLSDLETGAATLNFQPLKPARVLEEAAELMRERARQSEIALDVRCPADLPPLDADRDRIHQVLLNLLDNALKYTPHGGRVTLIGRAVRSPNGAAIEGVELAVEDTGEGIPDAHIPRLTERFYRVDRARSRELGGTGLGLAIVKHIVQLHRGRLQIQSRVREGTTVTVWLPAAPSAP